MKKFKFKIPSIFNIDLFGLKTGKPAKKYELIISKIINYGLSYIIYLLIFAVIIIVFLTIISFLCLLMWFLFW